MPTNAQCRALPPMPAHRLPIRAGERLEYAIDFLGGVKAVTVTMHTQPPQHHDGALMLPVSVHAESNDFFSKFGKIDSNALTWLRLRDLHPMSYHEDFIDSGRKYLTEVSFPASGPHVVKTHYVNPTTSGDRLFPYASDALDAVSTFYVLRSLDLRVGQRLCFDAYGSRTLWRIWGTVDGREAITTPAGTFQALRLAGTAARLNAPKVRRGIYLWISDDAQRLPVAAIGDLDVGPMRALLSGVGSGAGPSEPAAPGPPPAPAASASSRE